MNKIRLLTASLGLTLLLAPTAALAAKADGSKAKTFAKYDLNHDGKLDTEEIAALQKDFAAAPKGELKHLDTDGDGKLSAEEIAKLTPAAAKKSGHEKKARTEKKSGGEKKAAAEPAKEDAAK
jgi:hypothetical protein